MPELEAKIVCPACNRSYNWKPEIAGKRVKCKCGNPISIAAQPPAPQREEPDDDLYALAELASDAKKIAKTLPPTIVPVAAAVPARQLTEAAPVAAARAGAGRIPLGYRGVTEQEKRHASASVLIDKRRDIQAPLILIAVGAILYLGYYAFHYHLGLGGLMATSIGLIILNIFETIILVVFALVVAGPLGVSFGGVGTAILKLAAIALFCDGVTTWVDGLLQQQLGGGGGIFGFGAIGLPVALGIYWVTLIYLFSMDAGDSWLVVIILSVFYRILRIVLLLLLLKLIFSFSGASGNTMALPSMGGSSADADPMIADIEDAKAHQTLKEARQFMISRPRPSEASTVNGWYDDGCKNVWFEVTRDINGKGDPYDMIAELPQTADARAKCFDLAKTYCKTCNVFGEDLQDTGQTYILVPLPPQR